MILVIADSHACMFSGFDQMIDAFPTLTPTNSIFTACRMGAYTAFGLMNKHEDVCNVIHAHYINKTDDIIIFAFGEVDCRAHIARLYLNENAPIRDLIKNTINNYFVEIDNIKSMGYNIFVCGTSPTSFAHDDPNFNYPIFGDTEIFRNNLVKDFNEALKYRCIQENYRFMDIFPNFINDDMTSKRECFMDNDPLHLKSSIVLPILEKEFYRAYNA